MKLLREMAQMLRDGIWRAVKEIWAAQAKQQSKLNVVRETMKSQFKTRCVDIGCKRIQSVLTKLRGGTVELRVEMGRWTD